MIKRCAVNPVITKDMVKPSNPLYDVEYTINPGVTEYNGETILLVRVAESVKNQEDDIIKIPTADGIISVEKNLPGYDYSDPRVIHTPDNMLLTTMSHFKIARSCDGINFTVDEKPAIYPDCRLELYGIEDARITKIDSAYYIVYTAVSDLGIIPCLAVTTDFVNFEKKGPIFHATNKDVLLFPEKIDGMYVALLRPMPSSCGTSDIWLAKSPDLLHWGEYSHILSPGPYDWNGGRVGGSLVPIKTDKGWLVVTHSSSKDDKYSMSAILLDLDDPSKLISSVKEPLMVPQEDYEVNGFFGNAIFPSGGICYGDTLRFYYGAADTTICMAETTIEEILNLL